jgi:hypothetical protein
MNEGGELAVTTTVTLSVVLPPEPVQTRTYVVVALGATSSLPLVGRVPDHPFSATHEDAFDVLQERVALAPGAIVPGCADKVTVGAGVVDFLVIDQLNETLVDALRESVTVTTTL